MNSSQSTQYARRTTQIIAAGALFSVFAFAQLTAIADPAVDLGTASRFAILSGAGITDVAASSVIVKGDVGASPITGAAIGLTAAQVLAGTIFSVDGHGPIGSVTNAGLLTIAKNDLTAAYNDAAARTPTVNLGVGDNQLGGVTLFPGVYRFGHAATANLIGTLTLDAHGVANPVWIFQATSDLVTAAGGSIEAPNSRVLLINGADSCDVFWQVTSSATIGTYTDFVGHILANDSITLGAYSALDGSALARTASVTLDHSIITSVDCSAEIGTVPTNAPDSGATLLLLGISGVALLVFKRNKFLPRV